MRFTVKHMNLPKTVFLVWLVALAVLNVYPFDENISNIFGGNKLVFRLDYLLHAALVLGFAWIYMQTDT